MTTEDQLHVHTDKTLYGTNETVWFSGYLIKSSNEKKHTLLSVAHIREDNREVMLQSKYKMQTV